MSNIPVPIHYGDVTDTGKLRLENRDRFIRAIQALSGQKIQIIVEKRKRKRSNNQSRYYWGCVIELISEHTGHTPDEVHEAMKWKFLRKQGRLETVRSTASLTTVEFEDYLAKIRMWSAQELSLYILLPSEIYE